jgi:hypothetical protein
MLVVIFLVSEQWRRLLVPGAKQCPKTPAQAAVSHCFEPLEPLLVPGKGLSLPTENHEKILFRKEAITNMFFVPRAI